MRLIGLMPARNEEWCIGLSARAALMWMDSLIILNHASTDGTARILAEIAAETGRLTIIEDPDPVWRERAHRQRLLETARERGATHIGLMDADEVLTGDTLPLIRDQISRLAPAHYLLVPFRAPWREPFRYRVDPGNVFTRAFMAVALRDAPRVCWKRDGDGYDFHHREPFGSVPGQKLRGIGGVMHLQFADWPRIVAKHALYLMTEVLRWPGRKPVSKVNAQYHATLDERGLITAAAPEAWWAPYAEAGLLQYLRLGLEPWQQAECRRLWEQHGPEQFAGLDLMRVCTGNAEDNQATPVRRFDPRIQKALEASCPVV